MYRILNNKLEGDIMKKSLRNALTSSIASVGFVALSMSAPNVGHAEGMYVPGFGSIEYGVQVVSGNSYYDLIANQAAFGKKGTKDGLLSMYSGEIYNACAAGTENGSVSNSTINIRGGVVKDSAAGGFCFGKGTISKNSINVSGGEIGKNGSALNYQGAYGGLSWGGGRVDYNNAYMSGGKTYLITGGATVYKGSATGNSVHISNDAKVTWGAAGGSTENGSAKNNKAYMSGGTVGNLTGAYVEGKGSISGNIATVDGGKIEDRVAGAYTWDGSASKNQVVFNGGSANEVYGGFIEANGSASSNKVIFNGGTAYDVYGAEASYKGSASSNIVEINGGTINNDVFGARAFQGAGKSNKVTVYAGHILGDVAGVYTSALDKTGAASGNSLYIYGGTIEGKGQAALSNGGKLSSNKVEMSGGLVKGDLCAANGYNASTASSNKVTLYSGTVEDSVMGASVTNAASSNTVSNVASSNTVTVMGGQAGSAYGAFSAGDGAVTSNKVTVSKDGKVSKLLVGGFSANGAASKNSVIVSDHAEVGNINGGSSLKGYVNSNKVTVSGYADTGDIIGGLCETGNAYQNSISLKDCVDVSGKIFGGLSSKGNTYKNTVSIKGKLLITTWSVWMDDTITGGCSDYGDATSNTVSLSCGYAAEGVAGGFVGTAGNALNNVVTISKAKVYDGVIGGYTKKGNASGNKVTISNAEVRFGDVYGGQVEFKAPVGDANGNRVTISNSTIDGDVYGGYTYNGEASKNVVSISNTEVNGDVCGGWSFYGETNNNSVTISGNSKIHGDVIGGISDYYGNRGNKITISGKNVEIDGSIMGYQTLKGKPKDSSSKAKTALVLDNWSGSVGALRDIDNVVFSNVNWENGATVMRVDSAVDEGLGVNVESISGYSNVRVGDSMTLLAAEGTENVAEAEQTSTTARVGLALDAELDILDNVATVRAINVSEAAKGIGESRTAATAFVNQGSDLIEDSLNNLDSITDGVDTFASVQGNTSKYETGSHVKVNGKSGIVGISKSVNEGKITYGAFFENGSGNYNTHFDGNRGDGKAVYNGGGLLLNTKLDKGVYVEASMRAGKLKNDLKKALAGGQGYHTETTYYGAHLGIGKLIDISETTQLDVYGKYIYTHNSDESFMIVGQKYEFDDLDSSRLKAGLRINRKVNDKLSLYYGTAYEYELDGKATNKVAGYDMNNPELKGGTILGEVGVTCAASSKWSLDLNVKGYAGQREGFTTNVQAVYAF